MTSIHGTPQAASSYHDAARGPNSPLNCHTIGRFSCAPRPLMYLTTIFCGMIPKMAAKTLYCLVESGVNAVQLGCTFLHNQISDKKMPYRSVGIAKSWSFEGIVKDAIVVKHLFQKTANAAWCTVVAPPTYYMPLAGAAIGCMSRVFRGNYHSESFSNLQYYTRKTTPNFKQLFTPSLREPLPTGEDGSKAWISP